jgi:MFS family permease
MAPVRSLKEYYKFDVFGFFNGFGGSVWGGLTYYMAIPVAFLVYLEASAMQIGLVTAIFWAGFALPQIWAAYTNESQTIKKHFMAKVLLLSCLSWLVLGGYVFITGAVNQTLSIWLFLGLYLWACMLVGMFIPGQFSLLYKIIPSERLGRLLGILFAVQFGGVVAAGPVIQFVNSRFAEPMNYAILFLMTFGISIAIMFLLLTIKEPEGDKIESAPSLGAYFGKCLNVIKTDKTLTKFIIGKWLMSGHYIMLAFMLAFFMSEKGFDRAAAGWFASFHSLGLFIGGFTITRIADKYGPKQMLLTSHAIALVYTLFAWLVPSQSMPLMFFAFVITGLAQISDNVGYTNMCLFCCPTIDKSTYIAVTNIGVNVLTVPLPIIFGFLMDRGVLGFNGMFSIVTIMMVSALLFVTFVVKNPQQFLDMKQAAAETTS